MKQYKIWYLASEVTPFAKTGGLGDVTGSLPKALKNKNQEIRLMMPKYVMINERKYILREVIRLKDIPVAINNITKLVNIKSAFLPESKVQIYFVEIPEFFSRSGLYSDSVTSKDYDDNAIRFAYFCRGALETLKILSWKPDIIHCNDWQTAFIPIYLKTVYREDSFLKDIKTVFTVHNISYQGIFEKSLAERLEINHELMEDQAPLEHQGYMNLIKGALHFADWVTTVSPSYAKEISTNEKYGYGLEKVIQKRMNTFCGILNGVDYNIWSPEKDRFIPFKYSIDDISGKGKNKQSLLSRMNLEYNENIPVIGMISRLVEQKGFNILLEALKTLIQLNIQFIILGIGDKRIENELEEYQKKYPQKVSFNKTFDETLAHMVEAGSDIFLMPSSFEPCGMNQLYSLKYGTIPIIYNIGGLKDTITNIDPDNSSGNGFTFDQYNAKELIKTIKKAIKLFRKKEEWDLLIKRAMSEDFSWEKSSDKYLEIYRKVLGENDNPTI
jgi:starch synthase